MTIVYGPRPGSVHQRSQKKVAIVFRIGACRTFWTLQHIFPRSSCHRVASAWISFGEEPRFCSAPSDLQMFGRSCFAGPIRLVIVLRIALGVPRIQLFPKVTLFFIRGGSSQSDSDMLSKATEGEEVS